MNYYKDDRNNLVQTKKPIDAEGLVEITEEEYDAISALKMAEMAKVAENPIARELAELKRNLAETDYKAIKYAEGLISEKDYLPVKNKRQAWRARINELEGDE